MTMMDVGLIDETENAVSLIEECLRLLGGDSKRALWSRTEIDPVINNLLELWEQFNIPNN